MGLYRIERYCVGLVFTENMAAMLIVEKKRPDWMAGMLNGIGGKVEDDESAREAMVRECREEAGLETIPPHWKHVVSMQPPHAQIDFFTVATDRVIDEFRPGLIDETVSLIGVNRVLGNVSTMPHLRWIIPLSLQVLRGPEFGRKLMIPLDVPEVLI